jgi:hypothetical protein
LLTRLGKKGRKIFREPPHPVSGGGEGLALGSGGDGWADFSAPFFDFGFDGVADLASADKLFVMVAMEGGGIGEAPVQTSC